jgi:uncharacterized protein YukE
MEDLQMDPSAMRSRAAALHNKAEALRAVGHRLDRRVEALRFEGPAAVRFRSAAAERSRTALATAHRLDEIADRLQHEAARHEQHADGRLAGA